MMPQEFLCAINISIRTDRFLLCDNIQYDFRFSKATHALCPHTTLTLPRVGNSYNLLPGPLEL